MNIINELERIWKEVVGPNLRYYPSTFLERPEENHEIPQSE
jgi:hypothetical protein